MKLRILLGCLCAAAALTASTGAASAAVPDGPFTMSTSSVKFEFVAGYPFTCTSNVSGKYQSSLPQATRWTVEKFTFGSCHYENPGLTGELTMTMPVMPKMMVTSGTETQISFAEFKPVFKFRGCVAQLGATGTVLAHGLTNPATSESTKGELRMIGTNTLSNCIPWVGSGNRVSPYISTYTSTPIGS